MNSEWFEKDFYQTLGVSKDASAAEIKKAYRKLARDHHPDAKPGDKAAEEKFKEISEAYGVLSNADKRKEYDEQRAMFASGGFRPAGAGGGGFGDFGTTTSGGGFDFSDLLGGMFGGGGAGTRTRTARARRGADVESEATLSFADAIGGVTVALRTTSDEACPSCHGTGARAGTVPRVCPHCEGSGMQTSASGGLFATMEPCDECRGRGLVVDDPCPTCFGSGRAASTHTMQVRIPAGVKDGQRIRLKGKGAKGENGGPAGDLYVTVHVEPHTLFGRKGDNLTVTVPVTFDEAALGAEISVPTLGGAPVRLKVPAGTPNGRTFRARGKGAPRKDGTKADLLVTVDVQVPSELDDATRAAVEAYREARDGTDPRAALFAGGA
ncbi:molecular chaperone DnaJ [Mumia flava]|uniref:Chaperone protein DnaJ n=1 Tax=Mumia flava TaxID=1348852 RepID=A0A0B2BNZ0_9ACTN|nr:molecular chaperone DnaJ [Mumia flava]PJJ57997.1 molecular chaperone DnaJ [Mumia flava]